jgi:hypothetical protein
MSETNIDRTTIKRTVMMLYRWCVFGIWHHSPKFIAVVNRVLYFPHEHFVTFLGVLNEDRGTAVVHSRLKNDGELEELLGELREKLGPENLTEPEPDLSLAVVSYGTQ